jgi:SAM-dependent methyltransferase
MVVPQPLGRLYGDLAWLWPISSPPADYVGETQELIQLIRGHAQGEARSLLHLGCGGGHNDWTFKGAFEVTGVDISEPMLGLARRLNPEVTYARGDMRKVRLDRTFDAVAILDSIGYMLTEEDLRAALATAHHHLRPGGVLVTTPDFTLESFVQARAECTTHRHGEVEVTFLEEQYDPDRGDTTCEVTLVYIIRHRGALQGVEVDRHLCGLFPRATWLEAIRGAGFGLPGTPGPASLGGGELFVGLKPP